MPSHTSTSAVMYQAGQPRWIVIGGRRSVEGQQGRFDRGKQRFADGGELLGRCRQQLGPDSVHDQLACTNCAESCTLGQMAASAKRINVTLDDEHAGKLARLAERMHMQEGTLARSLLATALDDADPDAKRITEILDAIPGAWERTQDGLAQARRRE